MHRSRPLGERSVTPGAPWGPVEVFDRLGSTNDEVRGASRALARGGRRASRMPVAVGSVGRGRRPPARPWRCRCWCRPPPSGASWVPLLAGVAVHRAVAEVAGVVTALKWPNDVLVPGDDDRKLAGLLCEWTEDGVVVGLGPQRRHRPRRPAARHRHLAAGRGSPRRRPRGAAHGLPRAPGPGARRRHRPRWRPPRPPTSRPAPRWAARSRCTSRAGRCDAVSRQASTMRAD